MSEVNDVCDVGVPHKTLVETFEFCSAGHTLKRLVGELLACEFYSLGAVFGLTAAVEEAVQRNHLATSDWWKKTRPVLDAYMDKQRLEIIAGNRRLPGSPLFSTTGGGKS